MVNVQKIVHKVSCRYPFLICTLYRVYTAILTASLQNILEISFSNGIILAASSIDLFLLSTISFFSRVVGAYSYLLMLFTSKKMLNSFKVNSPLMSNLKYFIFTLDSFSTLFLKKLHISNASHFSIRNATHIILMKSSTKLMN